MVRPAEPVVTTERGLELETVKVDVKVVAPDPTRKYWIGTIKGAPYWNIYLGSRCFPHHTELVIDKDGGQTSYIEKLGVIEDLSEADVRRIKEDVCNKVVRRAAGRAFIKKTDAEDYRYDPSDTPLAKYVYMVKVTDTMPPNWRESEPPTMLG